MNAQQRRERADAVDRAAATARRIAVLGAEIRRCEGLLPDAEQAFADHERELARIALERAQLSAEVNSRGVQTAPDGRPHTGPSQTERARYERLVSEAEVERARWQAWRDARKIRIVDRMGIDRSWSERDPTALQVSLRELRRELRYLENQLDQVALSPGERVQAGLASPELIEHRESVERLRQRVG